MSDLRSAVERAISQFTQGIATRDAGLLARCYHTQARLLPPNAGPVLGLDAIEQFWRGALDMGVESLQLESQDVEEYGDMALELGTYRLAAPGATDTGKYLVVWKLENGAWKMSRDMWNSSLPAAAGT